MNFDRKCPKKNRCRTDIFGNRKIKKKTSSIRGGTRSGSQSSWWRDDIRRLTFHQLIFSGNSVNRGVQKTMSSAHNLQNLCVLRNIRIYVPLVLAPVHRE